jgi:hypothetical protein
MRNERPVNQDFEEFIRLLNKYKVEYCVIGGYAVAFHAAPRYTEDIDVYVSRSAENAKKVADALKEFVGNNAVGESYFVKDRVGEPPNKIEILNFLDGADERAAIAHRVKSTYGIEPVYYIGIDDLIACKKAVKDKSGRRDKKGVDDSDIAMLSKSRKKQQKG